MYICKNDDTLVIDGTNTLTLTKGLNGIAVSTKEGYPIEIRNWTIWSVTTWRKKLRALWQVFKFILTW